MKYDKIRKDFLTFSSKRIKQIITKKKKVFKPSTKLTIILYQIPGQKISIFTKNYKALGV
jgi:hypothetical protein